MQISEHFQFSCHIKGREEPGSKNHVFFEIAMENAIEEDRDEEGILLNRRDSGGVLKKVQHVILDKIDEIAHVSHFCFFFPESQSSALQM